MIVGLGVAIASGLADLLAPAGQGMFGWKQAVGCMLGFALFLAGLFLWRWPQWSGNLIARVGVAAYISLCSLLLSSSNIAVPPTVILLGYAAAICVLLPLRIGIAIFLGIVLLHVVSTAISAAKAGLTGLPLTILDIRIALRNPAGLWDTMAFPHWTRHAAVTVIALGIVLLALDTARAVRQSLRALRRGERRWLFARLIAVGAIGVLASTYLKTLYAEMAADGDTWEPAGVVALSNRMGVLPFLAYSYKLEIRRAGELYLPDDGSMPITLDEIRTTARRILGLSRDEDLTEPEVLPNLVVILAESTFDPGHAFRIEGQWDDYLFVAGRNTVAAGPLRVNALGGGTWISEFESIVGLDSRFFGYSGFYTHSSVAPLVQRSIATYLGKRGYSTMAFFPTEGEFYNARSAYHAYGFQAVYDSADLGHSGWITSDVEIVERVTTFLGHEPPTPLFAYVVLLENHAPHECGTSDDASFSVRFSDSTNVEFNCALSEYVRRLHSTSTAVRHVESYLEGIESRTGRPFVLLVFGDHQPHTFTATGGFNSDYSALRNDPDVLKTFFHVKSSVGRPLNCCAAALPTSALPTLLSSFVARSVDELYLGENLWLTSRCGADALNWHFNEGMTSGSEDSVTDERTKDCRIAYRRALTSFRAENVVNITASQ